MAGQKFPQVGLRAVFDISDYQKNYQRYTKSLRDIDRATQQAAQTVSRSGQQMAGNVAQSLEELVQKSSILQDLTQFMGQEFWQNLQQAFDDLGDNIGVDVDKFEDLLQTTGNAGDALKQSATALDTAAQSSANLSQSLVILTSAYQAVAPALRAAVRFVQVSIEEYNELAEATRRLRYQTGLASEEASSWVLAMQATGLSAASSQRALTSFLDKVAETSREQALGEESSSQFAEAIDILGVELKNADGTLKTTSDLLTEVDAAFKRLGPGAQSASAAQALFGYSGRFLLPILLSERTSLEDLNKIAQDYGGTLSALSQKEYEDFVKAQFQLLSALQGVYNHIAKRWTPVLTSLQRIMAASINIWRTLVQIAIGTEAPMISLTDAFEGWAIILEKINDLLQKAANAAQWYRDALHIFGTAAREATRAEEERAEAMARAAQAASEARAVEEKRQEAIQEAIQGLNELKTQYISKLNDIDRDAARKWDDILVQRMRAAMDRARQDINRIQDLGAALDKQLAQIEIDAAKRWEDILVNRQRDALLRGLRLAFRYEDLARNAERSRLDAIRDAADREAGIRRDAQKRVADAERDAQRRREELEREHQRRIRDIRQQFIDTATEAARRNDAVAVARAQRQRARDLRDERQRYDDERSDLERALAERRQDIERDRAQREQDHRNELARALQRIEENYARQREELERQAQRERLIRAIQYRWELEDFEAAKAEQKQAAQDAYDEQIAALQLANDRYNEELAIQYRRQEEDFNKAWQQRIDEANEWYAKERDDLAAHLSLTGQQLEAIYADWAREAAAAAAEVARATADALASEIIRYQHLLTEADRARATATPVQPGAFLPPIKAPYSVGPYPGAPVYSQAEGGVMQANSPTHVVMGDAGPETAVFMPGRAGSLNVNHNFGRMGVDFNGLPGGMNTQQVQNIVYSVMTQLAKGIQVPRN